MNNFTKNNNRDKFNAEDLFSGVYNSYENKNINNKKERVIVIKILFIE
jgi:hypothetical protein